MVSQLLFLLCDALLMNFCICNERVPMHFLTFYVTIPRMQIKQLYVLFPLTIYRHTDCHRDKHNAVTARNSFP
jgi:hypothetical protein